MSEKKKQAVINLDNLGKVRTTASSTIRQVRNAQAAEQLLRAEPIMPLVTAGNYMSEPLFEFDESDPLLLGATIGGDAGVAVATRQDNDSSSGCSDSDNDGIVRLANSRKRKRNERSRSAAVANEDAELDVMDSSDDDFSLSTQPKRNSPAADSDSSEDDFMLSSLKKKKPKSSAAKKAAGAAAVAVEQHTAKKPDGVISSTQPPFVAAPLTGIAALVAAKLAAAKPAPKKSSTTTKHTAGVATFAAAQQAAKKPDVVTSSTQQIAETVAPTDDTAVVQQVAKKQAAAPTKPTATEPETKKASPPTKQQTVGTAVVQQVAKKQAAADAAAAFTPQQIATAAARVVQQVEKKQTAADAAAAATQQITKAAALVVQQVTKEQAAAADITVTTKPTATKPETKKASTPITQQTAEAAAVANVAVVVHQIPKKQATAADAATTKSTAMKPETKKTSTITQQTAGAATVAATHPTAKKPDGVTTMQQAAGAITLTDAATVAQQVAKKQAAAASTKPPAAKPAVKPKPAAKVAAKRPAEKRTTTKPAEMKKLLTASMKECTVEPPDLITPNLSAEEEDNDEPMQGFYPEESDALKRLDRQIFNAEEAQLLDRVDDQITLAEEEEITMAVWEDIKASTIHRRGPGGLVQAQANLTEGMTPQQLALEKDWEYHHYYHGAVQVYHTCVPMMQEIHDQLVERQTGVLGVDYMGNEEVCVKKELPKYLGDTQELLLTEEEVKSTLVQKISQEGPLGDFYVSIKDKKDDPYTIVVELRGEEQVLERAKKYIKLLVRAQEMRFVSLGSKKTSKPTKPGSRLTYLYTRFATKYENIRNIDFGGIHAMSVISSMWHRHKERFGPVCNPGCPCTLELDVLTSTVIADAMKKNPNFERPPEIGFSKRFAPKFMPLLRKEFPRETNENIFHRLIRMWQEHLKQQRFGTSCREACPCIEGWNSNYVFKKGKLEDPTAKGNSSDVKAGAPVSARRQEAPLKRSNVSEARAQFSPHGTSLAAPARQKEYEVVFDARLPLGFFCATQRRVCKILSVSSSAKDERLTLETIVVSVSTGNSQEWHPIHSHAELQAHYENCREHIDGKRIRIRFINTNVKPSVNLKRDNLWTTNNAWKGKPNIKGWAGGANLASTASSTNNITDAVSNGLVGGANHASTPSSTKITKETSVRSLKHEEVNDTFLAGNLAAATSKPNQPSKTSTSLHHDESHLQKQAQSSGASSSSEPLNEQILQNRQPNHHGSNRPPSIFKKQGTFSKPQPLKPQDSLFRNLANVAKRSKPVRLKWAEEFETRLFDSTANANEQGITDSTATEPGVQSQHNPTVPKSGPRNSELLSAISHKSSVEVFELLKAGADTKPEGINPKDVPEAFAKRIRESHKSEVARNPTDENKRKYNDAFTKVNLLKIFERARDVMDNTRCLKKWARYDFRIDRIENLRQKSATPQSTGDMFICEVKIKGEVLGTTPRKEVAESIEWPDGSGQRFPFHYNGSLPERYSAGRSTVVLTFRKTIGNSQRTIELAEETRKLDEISSAVTGTDDATFKVDMPATEFLESARAVISVRKLRDDTKRKIEEQRNRYRDQMKQLINDVKAFNKDRRRESAGMHELDFNLKQPEYPHITPLHAAVYLNDVSLVADLVALGADVNAKSGSLMSPRTLAYNMAEKYSNDKDREKEIKNAQKILEHLGFKDASDYKMDTSPLNEDDEEDADVAMPPQVGDGSLLPEAGIGTTGSDKASGADKVSQGGATISTSATGQDERSFPSKETNPSRKRDRSPDKSPQDQNFTRHADLPDILIGHLIGGKKVCRHYGSSNGCNMGKKCFFAHIEHVNLQNVDLSQHRPVYRRQDLNIKEVADRNGGRCYTASYCNRDKNIFLLSVGGKTMGTRSGVFWYRTQDDATAAIEQVITRWQNPRPLQVGPTPKREPEIRAPPPHGVSTTPLSFEPASRRESEIRAPPNFAPPLRRDSTIINDTSLVAASTSKVGVAANPQDECEVFERLIHANLSNSFIFLVKRPGKIHGQGLKNSDWKTRLFPGGWIHASFTKWVAPNFPLVTFTSMGHPGQDETIYMNGLYYHNTLQRAKASAFLEFLKFSLAKGFLLSLSQRIDSKTIPFWNNR